MERTETTTPTGILMAEHRVIELVLDCLDRIADTARGEFAADDARRAIQFFRTFADACHHGKEEALLFPALERHGLPSDVGPTAVMRSEHEIGRAHVREMLAAVERGDPDAFAQQARAFGLLLREHIMKEDQVLFPMADRMIPPEGQTELLEAFGRVEHDDIGPGVHDEFVALAKELCERYGVEPRDRPAGGACFSCGHG